MGRVIAGTMLEKTPIVLLKEKDGSTFIGTKVKQKPGKQPDSFIFEFSADGGDAFIGVPNGEKVIKNGKAVNKYVAKDIEQGDKVTVFGDQQLNDKLNQVQVGEQVQITFKGFVLNPNTNRVFADYIVEVL